MEQTVSISSRDNPKLKLARRVREGKEPELLFIEGVRLAEEALRSGLRVEAALVADDFEKGDEHILLIDNVKRSGTEVYKVSLKLFRAVSDTKNPQGIILLAGRPASGITDIERNLADPKQLPLVVFLEEINNPSNLGAILRTAEAAGAAGVIVSKNSADVFAPKSLRASMGSAFRVPVWPNAEFDNALLWAKEAGLVPTAADITGVRAYTDVDWAKPRMLLLGSEAHGLAAEKLANVPDRIRIPMTGVESLNLAVACGIILFEARRQTAASSKA